MSILAPPWPPIVSQSQSNPAIQPESRVSGGFDAPPGAAAAPTALLRPTGLTLNERETVYKISPEKDVKDCGSLTDLHSSQQVSEVEIISLLGESLPRYQLRADYLTQFGGYEHSDFVIQTPVLSAAESDRVSGLTPEQAKATLDYFVTCGDRLSQMTKTYHDVEAVTRLLEEKEKDLELAAKIGQELLERNRFLEDKVRQIVSLRYMRVQISIRRPIFHCSFLCFEK